TTLMGQDVLPGNRYLKYLKLTDTPNLIALSDFHNTVLKETTGYIARQVIPWGIPTTEVPVTVPERRPIDVLGVGSLVPVKNWGRWLRIVREAANQVPDLQAVLIGNGPEENRLKEQAHALGLEPYLRFAGKLDRPDVLAHMAQSKVLLHTARFESFGYVFVEAAAQGCRIVSTPVGCAPAHWACSPNDDRLAALLAKAIQAPLPNQPDVPYSMEQTTQAYLELYGNVKKV
ncbi:MAG: glycosyltransferase, partial [Bacteroidetes bacterium]